MNEFKEIAKIVLTEENGQVLVFGENDTYAKIKAGNEKYYGMFISKENIGEDKFDMIVTNIENMLDDKMGNVKDEYHSFRELYDYRKAYNACLFNAWAKDPASSMDIHKSYKHSDGEDCFGGGWFVVQANTPYGQISNHYKNIDWDLFQVPIKEKANEWDGHSPADALERLLKCASSNM